MCATCGPPIGSTYEMEGAGRSMHGLGMLKKGQVRS